MNDRPSIYQPDPFLSGVLGRPAFALSLPPALGAADVSLLQQWLESGEVSFVHAKTDEDDHRRARQLQSLGFNAVADLVMLEQDWMSSASTVALGYTLRWAEAADEAAVVALARTSFQHSRFHADPAVSTATADAIKAAWAANFFRGQRGEAMAVVETEHTVVGFLLLLVQDTTLILDLLAVSAAHRGRGLGAALVAWVAAAWPGPPLNQLRVGTQRNNAPALSLYHKAGFTLQARQRAWHWHAGR